MKKKITLIYTKVLSYETTYHQVSTLSQFNQTFFIKLFRPPNLITPHFIYFQYFPFRLKKPKERSLGFF